MEPAGRGWKPAWRDTELTWEGLGPSWKGLKASWEGQRWTDKQTDGMARQRLTVKWLEIPIDERTDSLIVLNMRTYTDGSMDFIVEKHLIFRFFYGFLTDEPTDGSTNS